MGNKKIVGIDLSINCPGICIGDSTPVTFSQCEVFFSTHTKKYACRFGNIEGVLARSSESEIEKFTNTATWISSLIPDNSYVFLEGYSMGATGRVFNIAENTAVLKYILYKRGIHVITVPPTELKKFATGAGNADKDKMIASFDARHGIDIKKMFGAEKAVSPITDVVDAWWLYEYGRSTIEG